MNRRFIGIFNVLMAFALVASCVSKGPDDAAAMTLNAPENLTLVANDGKSMKFKWTEVEGAEGYTARLELASGTLQKQLSVKVNEVVFDGLTSGTAYSVKVKAYSGSVVSDYCEAMEVVAGSTDPSPDPDPEPDPEPDPDPTPDPTPDPDKDAAYSQLMIPSYESENLALAFPGAEGGGMYATGGIGGKVIHVTNLNDSGAGSLRAAISESGPRTVVFDVAGVIELKSELKISKGDLTIAGQTAPGDGICIKNYSTVINADNVIIRYLRFRLGEASKSDGADAIWGRYHKNIIIDHCSMSWSIDECASFYANCNVTLQWCIITESLRKSEHGKGDHGYGGIWGGKDASFHHNMLSNHDSRNPRIDHPQIYGEYVSTHRGNVDIRNNTIYNWGSNSTYGGEDGHFNIVNNYYKPGPASTDRNYFVDAYGYYEKSGTVYADEYPLLYLSGNVHTKYPGAANDASMVYWHNGSSYGNYNKVASSLNPLAGPSGQEVFTTTHSAADAFRQICKFGGASVARDAVDERACRDAESGNATITNGGNGSSNGLIDTPSAAGGWPEYKASQEQLDKVKDSDSDGMPDWFEDLFKLDKNSPDDGNFKTLDKFGRYTNLEMYLHYIVREAVSGQNEGGNYMKIS